jgi:hypothetical protein
MRKNAVIWTGAAMREPRTIEYAASVIGALITADDVGEQKERADDVGCNRRPRFAFRGLTGLRGHFVGGGALGRREIE